jgi:hypothetical protein
MIRVGIACPCWAYGGVLTASTARAEISAKYRRCLCPVCLSSFEDVPRSNDGPA